MNFSENESVDTHAVDDHCNALGFDADNGMVAMEAGGTHADNTQQKKAMNIHSLQDLTSALKKNPSSENADLLLVADLFTQYFKRPSHQITIEAVRGNKGYFMLYLSYLRMPLESIDHFVGLAGALVAKADGLVRENSPATETNAARSTEQNCAEHALNSVPHKRRGRGQYFTNTSRSCPM